MSLLHTHTHGLAHAHATIHLAAAHFIYLLIELLRGNIIGCKMSKHTHRKVCVQPHTHLHTQTHTLTLNPSITSQKDNNGT